MPNLFPLFVPIAPLIAAFITAFPNNYLNNRKYKISWWIIFAGFITSLVIFWQAIKNPEPIRIILFTLDENFLLGKILPQVILSFDRLSAVMMVVISGFGIVLYHYSIRYLQQDDGQQRFQALLALLISSLIFMVLSADLVTLFIFWQLLSWFLCLLFHNYAHIRTAQSSFRTFIMLRAGDLIFLAGIVLAYHLYGTVQFSQLFESAALDQTHFALFGMGLEVTGTTLVTLLIFIGVMSKSAQFPLHMWLPDSLYAPTSVSVVLHAGIINAGGFLLTRLAPLYALSSTTLHFILMIGLLTMILGKCMMLVQNDIKKTLVYSTIGQMGYMIMECGVGAFSLAIFHLIAHGLFKAYLFLDSGNVIHETRLYPKHPSRSSSQSPLNMLGWIIAFILSFLIPLGIVILVHKALGISFLDFHGLLILLLFSWVTASQAMLTLFRLKKTLLTKGSMLVVVALVAMGYFFAVEQFTHFLNPNPKVVAAYFQAAELPHGLFLALIILLIVLITVTWFLFIYGQRKDESKSWFGSLKLNLYLFFMNRLYLDGLLLRLDAALKRMGRKFDRSPTILIVALASSLLISFRQGVLPIISALAIVCALWGSIKALLQVSVPRLLFYGGFAQGSIFFWHFAQTGKITPDAALYIWAATLSWIGLFLAWGRIRARYGNLNLNQIGGLFQPMPRFAVCLSLVAMAAMGLPPFSLFFGYLGILLSSSTGISYGIVVIIVIWFVACCCLFKLMSQLLFGPFRKDICYEDLTPVEITVFVILIGLLIIPGSITQDLLMEVTPWIQ